MTDDIKTENGVMILNLVKYLKERFIEEIPYLGFLVQEVWCNLIM